MPDRLSTDRRIILLDQEPLRRATASECSKVMAHLERARAEWKRFESEDKTAFQQWMAATFGALLSQLRDTAQELEEKESIVSAVEFEMFVTGGGGGYRAAYKRVIEERDRPPENEQYTPPPTSKGAKGRYDEFEEDFDEFDDFDEFEQMMMFEEFVVTVLGLDPSFMSDEDYETAFAEFRAQVFGRKQAQPDPEIAGRSFPVPKSEDSRIKEVYRILVRRLHPDTRADSDAEVSALWHEVQEAYAQGNLERLEMLLALTDMKSNGAGEHTSLFQMRSVLAELNRALNALQQNLNRAKKKDPAWGFAARKKLEPLEKRVRRELQQEISWLRSRVKDLNRLIESWKRGPGRKKKKAAKKAANQKPKKAAAPRMEQTDLPF